jgi:hypothetical protein
MPDSKFEQVFPWFCSVLKAIVDTLSYVSINIYGP